MNVRTVLHDERADSMIRLIFIAVPVLVASAVLPAQDPVHEKKDPVVEVVRAAFESQIKLFEESQKASAKNQLSRAEKKSRCSVPTN